MVRRAALIVVTGFVVVCLRAAAAEQSADLLARAQSLAWAKHFDEAASIYAEVLRREPSSHDATLGLARVRLWQARYAEARTLFRRLVTRNRADTEAAEGAATAAYWSGDYRTAERELRAIAADHPGRETVERSLEELRSASAPIERFEAAVVDDDQPFRGSRTEARASMFTDPLTRWDGIAGAYTVSSDEGGRHMSPFALARNETVLPALRLTLTSSLGAIRTPDSRTHAIGGASARVRVATNDSVILGFTRREMFANATTRYPLVDVASLRWDHAKPWLASAGVERDRFSDDNTASAADAYALFPILKFSGWTLWTGASGLYRDTRDSRFYVTGINSTLDPSGTFFHYTYRGAYDPYWTPHDLREGRLIAALERPLGRGMIRLQADRGRAKDDAVTFWPDAAPRQFPSHIGRSLYHRTYSPWRMRLTASTPAVHGLTAEFSIEHSVTAFYRANTFHATLARRR